MSKSLAELHEERGRLRERITGQRSLLAQQFGPMQSMSDAGGRVLAWFARGAHYLQTHPLALLGALSVLALVRPSRAWRWAQRGVFVWRSWRMASAWLASWLQRWRRRPT